MQTEAKLTQVFLNDDEALAFIQFQKHYALVKLLESIKAFDIRGGSITIHFGTMGEIKTVDKHEYFRV